MVSTFETLLYFAAAAFMAYAIYYLFFQNRSTAAQEQPPQQPPQPQAVPPYAPIVAQQPSQQPSHQAPQQAPQQALQLAPQQAPQLAPQLAPQQALQQRQPRSRASAGDFSAVACKEMSGDPQSRLWEDCLNSAGASSCVPLTPAGYKQYQTAAAFCTNNPGFRNMARRRGPLDAGVRLVPQTMMDPAAFMFSQSSDYQQGVAVAQSVTNY